jgi:hypothetical protein
MKKANFGDVDMDFVLGIGGYDLDRLVVLVLYFLWFWPSQTHNYL